MIIQSQYDLVSMVLYTVGAIVKLNSMVYLYLYTPLSYFLYFHCDGKKLSIESILCVKEFSYTYLIIKHQKLTSWNSYPTLVYQMILE